MPSAGGKQGKAMKRTAVIALVFLASGVTAAQAQVKVGQKCTTWGATSSAGLVCAQVDAKSKLLWVRIPSAASATKAPAPAKKGGPTADSIPAGQWLVGTEVSPGTFRTSASDCYYQRLSGFGGSTDEIISNGNTGANGAIVTIAATDKAFDSQCSWTRIA